MNKSRALWLVVLCLLILGSPASARAAPHVLKVATVLPQGGPWAAAFSRFAAEVKRQTRGQVIFKLYFGAVAGTEERALTRMRAGQLQGVAAASAALSYIDSSIRVLELPMLFRSHKEFTFVLRSMQPEFVKRFRARGYQILAMAGVGWVYVYSKHLISSVADLKRRKVWRWKHDPLAGELFRMLGVSGHQLPAGEVLPSLQTGSIDTVYGMAHTTQALQWHTSLSYLLDLRINMAIAALVVRNDAFDRLSAAQQRIVLTRAAAMQRHLNQNSSIVNRKSRRAMLSGGLKLIRVPPSFLQQLQQINKQVYNRLRNKVYRGADLKKVRALITLCRNTSCRS